MMLAASNIEREYHPVDIVEKLASMNDWSFDRCALDEINITITGRWSHYAIAFNWRDDLEALHLSCAFDIRILDDRSEEMLRLLALINEQLWLGHFDLWANEGTLMFRHSLLLTGGLDANLDQCQALLDYATNACDRYYQSFHYVLWAGETAEKALESSLFETVGSA